MRNNRIKIKGRRVHIRGHKPELAFRKETERSKVRALGYGYPWELNLGQKGAHPCGIPALRISFVAQVKEREVCANRKGGGEPFPVRPYKRTKGQLVNIREQLNAKHMAAVPYRV